MSTCKFCNTSFSARPQVKNPQACSKKECQKLRQRKNEKDWLPRISYKKYSKPLKEPSKS